MASLQAFPFSLLPRAWSRALIPFPFPFERLPRRLEKQWFPGRRFPPSFLARPSRFSRAQNSLSQNSLSLPFQTPATQASIEKI